MGGYEPRVVFVVDGGGDEADVVDSDLQTILPSFKIQKISLTLIFDQILTPVKNYLWRRQKFWVLDSGRLNFFLVSENLFWSHGDYDSLILFLETVFVKVLHSKKC